MVVADAEPGAQLCHLDPDIIDPDLIPDLAIYFFVSGILGVLRAQQGGTFASIFPASTRALEL